MTTERPPLTRDELRDVLVVALRAGQIMLENGANTARVEETVHRLGTALGADWLDVYVTPGGIIASGVSQGEHRTRIQRVVRSGIDLSRIEAVIAVSRLANEAPVSIDLVRNTLERVAAQPRLYGHWLTIFAVGLACAAAAVLFGGGLNEALLTFVTAMLTQFVRESITPLVRSRLVVTGLSAALGTALAYAATQLFPVQSPTSVLLASVLMLVPGVVMVSAVADLFRGDTISGTARGVNAGMLLTTIGAGIWGVLLLTGTPTILNPGKPPHPAIAVLCAAIMAGGFGILFDVPRRAVFSGVLVGLLGYGCRVLSMQQGVPIEAATFLAGFFIGLLAEILARIQRMPTAMFTVPAFITLVPGVTAFGALLHFVSSDYGAGTEMFIRALLLTGALAGGFGTVNVLARIRQRPVV